MSKYTVAIKEDGEATARTTEDLDDALDWFTNAVTGVMDDEDELTHATLQVDGITVGIIAINGIGPDGEVMTGPKLRRVA